MKKKIQWKRNEFVKFVEDYKDWKEYVMSYHIYFRNHYFDPDLEIVTILTDCQDEALKKVEEATRLVKKIEQQFPHQFAKDAIAIDLLLFFRDNLVHTWFDLHHQLSRTFVITKLAYSTTNFDPIGTLFFRTEEEQRQLLAHNRVKPDDLKQN